MVAATGVLMERNANNEVMNSNGILIGRDPEGQITRVTFSPGKFVEYSYDARGQVTEILDWTGNLTELTHDELGRVIQISRANAVVTNYSYDNDGRISGMETLGAASASIQLQRDAIGNVTTATRNLPLKPVFINTQNSISPDDYQYDQLGRVLTDGANSYEWNLAGLMTGYNEQITLQQDALGHITRRQKDSDITQYVWNFGFSLPAISIISGTGGTRYYVHLPGGDLLYSLAEDGSGQRYFHYDEVGNTVMLTDESGVVTDAYAYSPYGQIVSRSGSTNNPFSFSGRYSVLDEGNGLYIMGRRVYSSAGAQFLSRDRTPNLSDPRSLNVYNYALGNPLRYNDPTGETGNDNAFWTTTADKTFGTGYAGSGTDTAVSTALTANKLTTAITGEALGNAVGVYGDSAAAITNANKLNLTFGQAGSNSLKAQQLINKTDKLTKLADKIGAAASVGKYAGLALDSYKNGPGAVAEEIASMTLEHLPGKAGKAAPTVFGVGVEAYKTNEKVKGIVNDLKKVNSATLDSHTLFLKELEISYKRGEISYETYERLFLEMRDTMDYTLQGSRDAGEADGAAALLEGFSNMLGKVVGL